MAQFKAMDDRVEVNGETVLSVVSGMAVWEQTALDILAENGIEHPVAGTWYAQQAWLDAFREISERIGEKTLHSIGKAIPRNAQWPPNVRTIQDGLGSIDVAYHMNHRIEEKPLFDPASGKMSEGIGHYRFKPIDEASAKMMCDNPYPCEFDRGIIFSVAERFCEKGARIRLKVEHGTTCRKDGGVMCVYHVSW